MLEEYNKLQSKPETTVALKVALQTIWKELPEEHINKTWKTLPHRCILRGGEGELYFKLLPHKLMTFESSSSIYRLSS